MIGRHQTGTSKQKSEHMHLPQRLLAVTIASAAIVFSFSINVKAIQSDGRSQFIKQGDFGDVLQDVKDAIINRGLVIDYIGHVDKMLERTSKTVGSVTAAGSKSPFLHAKYLQFCSAKLTHESVSANPYNLAICPYVVFVFEAKSQPGQVVIGYRRPIPGPSKRTQKAFGEIEQLLQSIAKEAAED
ncbi:MAG: DUF302 domain-containing protein [Hyphomicrobiaceae bacterium]